MGRTGKLAVAKPERKLYNTIEQRLTAVKKEVGANMIYLLRHGQTAQNKARRLQGRSEHPLDETGEEQARAVGRWFEAHGIRIAAVYASPLQRAIRTAELAAGPAARVRVDGRLIEMDYGPYEGMNLMSPAPEVLAFFQDFTHNPAPQGMEPLEAVVARLGAFLEERREEAERQDILVSTHAIAMKGALEYLTPRSRGSYWSKYIGNCAVYRAECADGSYGVPVELIWEERL